MYKFIIAILFLTVIACSPIEDINFDPRVYECEPTIPNTHVKSEQFELFLEEQVAAGLPGISMLVQTPEGRWTGSAGVVEIPFQTPMQSCNVHRIGSSTKVFMATIIFQLYEQGLLDLDDPIINYLPNDRIEKIENHEEITIRQLLNHTSGIPEYLDINLTLNYYDDLTRIWTDEEELNMIEGQKAVFQPGEYTDYSNTNYLLLGMIAKEITGKTATDLFQDNIFTPLGMTNTFFNENGENPEELVRGYYDENGNGDFIDITDHAFARHSVAGGASSTVEDLYTFIKAFWETENIITDATKTEITSLKDTPFLHPDQFEYGDDTIVKQIKGIGLCWFQYDTDFGLCIGHDGGFNGRRSVFRYFPDSGVTIIYLVNGSGESLKNTLRAMRRNDVMEIVLE